MLILRIKADINDADWVYSFVNIQESLLEKIRPVIQAIKEFKPYEVTMTPSWSDQEYTYKYNHNYPMGNMCDSGSGEKSAEELYGHIPNFQEFHGLVPYPTHGEDDIHSIESIDIIEVKEKLL